MEASEIDQTLSAAQAAVDADAPLAGTGFWKAVASVKAQPELVDQFAHRIAEIDRKAFLRWSFLAVGAGIGTAVMGLATLFGVALVVWSFNLPDPWNGLAMLGGGGGVLVMTTHGLGHLVAGRVAGIRFTHWFIGSPHRPQPGVKVDYSTYLRASPRARAWMHASGALVTKAVPFALLVPATGAEFPTWTLWLLLGQGVLQIFTDAVWSVRTSDWKKFRREMSYV